MFTYRSKHKSHKRRYNANIRIRRSGPHKLPVWLPLNCCWCHVNSSRAWGTIWYTRDRTAEAAAAREPSKQGTKREHKCGVREHNYSRNTPTDTPVLQAAHTHILCQHTHWKQYFTRTWGAAVVVQWVQQSRELGRSRHGEKWTWYGSSSRSKQTEQTKCKRKLKCGVPPHK